MKFSEFDAKAQPLIAAPTVASVLAEVDRRIQSLKLKEPVKVHGTVTDPSAAAALDSQIVAVEQAIKDAEAAALAAGDTPESLASDGTLNRRKENLKKLKADREALKGPEIEWAVCCDEDEKPAGADTTSYKKPATGVGDDPKVQEAALANAGRILDAAIRQKEREVAAEAKKIGNAVAALRG